MIRDPSRSPTPDGQRTPPGPPGQRRTPPRTSPVRSPVSDEDGHIMRGPGPRQMPPRAMFHGGKLFTGFKKPKDKIVLKKQIHEQRYYFLLYLIMNLCED